MKVAAEEAKALEDSWLRMRSERVSENDMTSFGYPGVAASDFDALFHQWSSTLKLAATKAGSSNAVDGKISDAVLAKIFRDIRNHVESARSQGLQWLITSTAFLGWVTEASSFIALVTEKRLSLRKDLLRSAQSALNDQLLSIEEAAPKAETISAHLKKIESDTGQIDSARAEAESTLSKIQVAKEAAEGSQAKITLLLEQANDSKGQLAKLATDFTESLAASEAIQKEIASQKGVANESIEKSGKLLGQANEQLEKALQDINRQGLAGAFSIQAKEIRSERLLWICAFLLSIAWLIYVAYSNANSDAPKELLDWKILLKALPLAAPGIWLGWLSARNSGMLSRLQQDYSYKATTAVAFEAHKKEVQLANDEALSKQLLEAAVRNFGENPIRLYEQKQDAGHPIESLANLLSDEKYSSKVIEILKAMKPETKK